VLDEQKNDAGQNFLKTSADEPAQAWATIIHELDRLSLTRDGYAPRMSVPAPVTKVASWASYNTKYQSGPKALK